MRKNGDFVFLRPVLRLGIGMMAALCERTISFTFDESGSTAVNTGSGSGEANGGSGGSEAGSIGGLTHNSYLCLNNGYKCFFVGGGATAFTPTYSPNDQTDTALRPVATVTIAKE